MSTTQLRSGARSLGPRLDTVLCWRWQPDPPVCQVEVTPVQSFACEARAYHLAPGERVTVMLGADRLILEHRRVAGGGRVVHVLLADYPITHTLAWSGGVAEWEPGADACVVCHEGADVAVVVCPS